MPFLFTSWIGEGWCHVKVIYKQSLRTIIILFLALAVTLNLSVPKANAFIPVVIGGLAIGEALFYTAGTAAVGFAMYDTYEGFKNEKISDKYLKKALKEGWKKLTVAAKESWANLEATVVAGAESVELTIEQWKDAIKAGIMGFSTTSYTVPGIPIPADRFNTNKDKNIVVQHEFYVKFAILLFEMNGEKFALMPWSVWKNSYAEYRWYHLQEDGWVSNYVPPSASTFSGTHFNVSAHSDGFNLLYDYKTFNPPIIFAFNYYANGWENAMMSSFDALPTIEAYLKTMYGGMVVSVPNGWAPTIPTEKDLTKPVAIPVPPGAITYPQTGVGSLNLTPEMVQDIVTDMVGTANPGTPGEGTNPPKGDWPDSLGKVVTTRFPFSLPWDLYAVMSIFNAPAITPNIAVDTIFMGMHFKFSYSFDFLDPYMPWIRGVIIAGFCMFLILQTRNLLGGAK